MSVLFLILPLAIALAGVAVFAFLRSARSGQFDDLDTPPWRVVFDDCDDSTSPANRADRQDP